ncbi:MAG: group II intron maturase-specific domain-containing protein, partial [Candidatus Paceibacterota bacterium]
IPPKVNLVRYADDFIVTGRNKEILEHEIMPLVKEFLSVRGLTLSEEKTKITHIDEGFDFLGFNVRKYDGKLLIKPSKEKVKKFLEKIRETIEANKSCKQDTLIRFLNPKITGWANYYKHCVASDTFSKADHQIFCKLLQWSKRRHPKKSTNWAAQKYFRKIGNMKWRFAVDYNYKGGKSTISLKRLSDTKITRYVKTQCDANPYDPEWKEYFEKRETYKMLISLKGRESLIGLWKKQKRVCPICKEPIDKGKDWYLASINMNGKTVKSLVHISCCRRIYYLNKKEDYEPVS